MASSGLQLFLFTAVMFLGSYFAGSAPLLFSLSEEKLQRVSVLGAGMLLGTALTIIIPEGVQTLIKGYTDSAKDQKSHHDTEGLDRAIGVSLVLGFVFMLLIDQLATSRTNRSRLDSVEATTSASTTSGISPLALRSNLSSFVTWTTTLGLVVHAAADGVALGAAAATNQTDVEVLVFLAIMLHKAPAAFGLTTFLLHEGLERVRVRRHLLIFSLAAPALAIFTYAILGASGASASSEESGAKTDGRLNTFQATGVAMLFSAGTFLYVATVHVLPEVVSNRGEVKYAPAGASSANSSGHSHHGLSFGPCDLCLLVAGALMPMVITLGHHH